MRRGQARGWRAVSMREWPAIMVAGATALAVEVGLRTTTLPRLARMTGVLLTTGPDASVVPVTRRLRLSVAERRRVRAACRVLRHWPFGDTCLRQALVIGHGLRHLAPTLRLGVARVDGEVRAHAWLDIDGALLDPLRSAAAYSPLQPFNTERHVDGST